jgi:ABC-type sugar transport system substrate-binding protein/tRNA A-37 threonylcarbamoyl transferase component Bud32
MVDSFIGKQINDFVIEERLGQGAMAVVYRAFQPSINRYVALKVIRLDEGQGQQEDFRRRFAREAEMIAHLEHIHILPIYAYGIDTEMAYLAMRWLKGGSLSELMRREKLPLERVASIFKQVAQGLSYAHSKGIIHRDLKPSNIMLDDTGNAYLTDFGLAKLTEGSGELTRSGTIVGTPAYMSPEQLRGETLDQRSDIYSMGVILYSMVAGRLPFEMVSNDLVSIIYQHLEKPPTPPSEFNPNLTPAVEQVVLRALQKNREERYFSAEEMSRALNEALGQPVSSDQIKLSPAISFLSGVTSSQNKSVLQRAPGGLVWFGAGVLVLLAVVMAVIALAQGVSASNVLATLTTEAQIVASEAAIIAGTQTAVSWTPTPLPAAVVRLGERDSSTHYVPDAVLIAAAHARLGEGGFIAYFACTQDSEFHAGLARQVTDLARSNNFDLRVYDSQADPYLQITQIERARTDGARAFIICPLDAKLLESTLKSAQEAGLPMVFFGGNLPSYGGILIGGDNYLLGVAPGRLAGQIIRDEMGGQANVIILDYPDLPDIVARADGAEDGVKEFAPNAKIIGRYLGATREFGKVSVAKLLAEGVQFDVIVSINDAGSFGAIDAMVEAGIDPTSVIVTSVDAEALAQQYIREGYFMRGSVQSSREESAVALMDAAIQLLGGGNVPELWLVPPGAMITADVLALTATPTPAP